MHVISVVAMAILRVCCARSFLIRVLVVSGLLALLQLATSLYMLAVYDRVLPSGSATALAGLTALAAVLHAAFAGLDAFRARMVCRAGVRFAEHLDGRLLAVLHAREYASGVPLLDDAERVRRFLTSAGPCAAFDLLWLPAFLATAFVLHPVLGLFACGGAAVLGGATAIAERRAREAARSLMQTRHARYVLAWDLYVGRTGAERRTRWQDAALRWDSHARWHAETTLAAAERALFGVAFGKGLRLILQSAGFGLGALLVMEGLLSAGALVASSLILSRAFACLDGALAHWSGFVAARESGQRLLRALEEVRADRDIRSAAGMRASRAPSLKARTA
jgi:ATP-binding cassette subfamily C protein PrsD